MSILIDNGHSYDTPWKRRTSVPRFAIRQALSRTDGVLKRPQTALVHCLGYTDETPEAKPIRGGMIRSLLFDAAYRIGVGASGGSGG